MWNIFVCLFVSKEFLVQLGAGSPRLLLKTGEEEEAGEFCQGVSHSCWTLQELFRLGKPSEIDPAIPQH